MIRGEGGEPPGRRALTKVASRWLIQKRVRSSLRARPGSSAQPTSERPQPSKPWDPGRRPFEPRSSSIRMRTPVFHSDGGVGVERTKPLKQVSAPTAGLSRPSLCSHLPASSVGSRRSGLGELVGGGAPALYLPRASHFSLGASVPLHPRDLS